MSATDSFAPPEAAIRYPLGGIPETGQVMPVAPGVMWARMPLGMPLNHINVYLLDDEPSVSGCAPAAVATIDTGMGTDASMQAWRQLFEGPLAGRPLSRVIATHLHPDHVGMAGWLTRKFNIRLWMTRLEYTTCRMLVADTGRQAPPEALEFYRSAGWNEEALETYRLRFGNFGKGIHTLPDGFRRMQDGEVLRIGQHEWRVVVGSGHCPEHACLYCPALKLLISGDQVLPRISSNVSVYPTEPDADPMRDWMNSIDKLLREVPDDVLVLPSHNEPFTGLHARLNGLAQNQRNASARLLAKLAQPQRVADVFGVLFKRTVESHNSMQLHLATGETIACLNHLLGQGLIRRSFDAHGVAWYQQT